MLSFCAGALFRNFEENHSEMQALPTQVRGNR